MNKIEIIDILDNLETSILYTLEVDGGNLKELQKQLYEVLENISTIKESEEA